MKILKNFYHLSKKKKETMTLLQNSLAVVNSKPKIQFKSSSWFKSETKTVKLFSEEPNLMSETKNKDLLKSIKEANKYLEGDEKEEEGKKRKRETEQDEPKIKKIKPLKAPPPKKMEELQKKKSKY
jgi:hypothetical protein